jgi:hypothetical protein
MNRFRRQNSGFNLSFVAAEVLVLEDRTLLSSPTFVQALGSAQQLQPASTSLNLTTTAAVGAGHSVILELAMMPAAGAVSAFAHAPGSNLHLVDFHVDADITTAHTGKGLVRTVVFSSMGTPALPAGTVITFTFPGSAGQAASAAEFRGLSAASPLDVTVATNGTASAVTSGMSGKTTAPVELLIGAVGVLGKPEAGAAGDLTHNLGFTAGGGYAVWSGTGTTSGKSASKNVTIHPEFEFVSSIGSYQANGSLSKAAIGKSTTVLAGYRADTADHFSIGAPASVASGQSFVVTVTARDAAGNVDSGYTGTVHWTSSDTDAGISLPANVTFTAADHGVRQFTIALMTDGTRSITLTDTENRTPISGTAKVQIVPAGFSVSGPTTATAGQPQSITVTARRFDGSVDPSYAGTVHFTSTDRGTGLALPADYAFTAADKGVHTFAKLVTLVTAGNQTVSATDAANPSVTGISKSVTVSPAAATQFSVTFPTTATAGTPFSITVTARDQFGNVAIGYAGTIHFTGTSSDPIPGSGLPADYTFVGGDAGMHTFVSGATLFTAGKQTITATDSNNIALTGSGSTMVVAAVATHFTVSAPPTASAGSPFSVTVTASDQFGNVATGYRGSIHFTKTDAGSGSALPADYAFTAGDAGAHTFTKVVTLVTAGKQTITATDLSNKSCTGGGATSVVASAATQFTVTAPSTATAGSPFDVTVTARDQYGNVATGYRGTIHFTTSDSGPGFGSGSGSATPADYTFTAGDSGAHTFTNGVTFVTAGNQSVTAADTANGALTSSSGNVIVTAAAATHFDVSTPATATAGSPFSISVTARDQFNNRATGYAGTIHVTKSDLGFGSALPADYTFTAADSGTHAFASAVTFVAAGSQTVTATDTSNNAVTSSSSSVTVAASGATHFDVNAPAASTAGVAFSVTVTARDQFGNMAAGYTGKIHLTKTDVNSDSALPADYTYTGGDAGVHTFTNGVMLSTTGSQSITATDSANGALTGSGTVSVTAAAVDHLTVSTPTTGVAGIALSATVTACDRFGNVATSYRGTVHFTKSDSGSGAMIPADYTFLSADGGTHTFTNAVTLVTAGNQLVTASDGPLGTGSGSVTVAPAAATHFAVSCPATAIAGDLIDVTVTARDQFNNVATGYAGTIQYTALNPWGTVQKGGLSTFVAGDMGSKAVLQSALFGIAGTWNLTATDTTQSSLTGSASLLVSPGATSQFLVGLVGVTPTAGTVFSVVITAIDSFRNPTPDYRGTVHFSSDDPRALTPTSDVTFAPANAGQMQVNMTFYTAGAVLLTATDVAKPGITGSVGPMGVAPNITTHFVITGPTTGTAGIYSVFHVTPEDAFGNVTPNYSGTLRFTTDAGTWGFEGLGNQDYGFFAIFVGTWTLTAYDANNSAITGTSNQITFGPAAATTFGVSVQGPLWVGLPEIVGVTAYDPYGNVATGYRGTVVFTVTGGTAQLPSAYTFTDTDQGIHVFQPLYFLSVSYYTLYVADTNGIQPFGSEMFSISPPF